MGSGSTAVARSGNTGEIRKLSTLLEVSQTLGGTLNLKSAFTRVLDILEAHHSMRRGSILLLEEGTSELRAEAWGGAGDHRIARKVHRTGEGIVGRVVQTGKPVVVPQVSHEPSLREEMGETGKRGREELSFICIPISVDRRSVGALAVDLFYKKDRDYDRTVKFFGVVASMLAQAIKVSSLIEAERQRLLDENIQLKQELKERYDFRNIVGTSSAMRQVYEQVAQVARTNTTVLIRGESGTGKELIAHAIHYNSLRARKPLVKVSCAALPESLIESELFGYEKGAFTDAHARKKGRFELADGGTIFLDEVGELSASTQIKLLRVIQEREFERLGGIETIKVNVRLIAATNKDVEEAMKSGHFRRDLYYRLNVFTIYLPPLRERRSDILLLADHFLEKYAREHNKRIKRISTPAIDMLMAYHWPGNVRELENCIERAVLVCESSVVHGHHLPPTLQTAEGSGTVTQLSISQAVEAYEKDLIQDALKSTRGNCARAARLLDSTERIIGYKIRKYRISATRFRQ